LTALLILAITLSACGAGSRSQTTPVATPGGVRPASLLLSPTPTPQPVVFPRDEAPHHDLTEWWYYTGHLATKDGRQFGFEFVIFQGLRGTLPPAYAAHFAITDIAAGSFHYAERTATIATPPFGTVPFTLDLGGWKLTDSGADATINASMPGYQLSLKLHSVKPPALHNTVGYFDFAPGMGSYYYSRTRIKAGGSLSVAGKPLRVSGTAWMDHQWGNFLTGSGGWDWFSIQLSDNQELMLWHSRDPKNRVTYGEGTEVAPSGRTTAIRGTGFSITATGSWTSPHSGATYPSGWTVEVPSGRIHLTLTPVLKDQELMTPKSTGVTYWEGDVAIKGTIRGQPVSGQGYVELTGYAPPEKSATPVIP